MKSLFLIVFVLTLFVLVPTMLAAQTDQATAVNPPVSQPLIREGTLALRLADVLKVGATANEAEAETVLSGVGIAPRNGWIGDYPVTPDIVGELQAAVSEAADAGRLGVGKDGALKTFGYVLAEYGLSVQTDTSGQDSAGMSAQTYPDSTAVSIYYYEEGPPIVTYYTPPPGYAYLYSWVPYPFWWWNVWFPGFFVLADFDVVVHGHHHRHGHDEHREFVSNHFRDPGKGTMSRVDPANRARGGILSDRAGRGWSSSSANKGAQTIFNGSRSVSMGRGNTVVTSPSGNGQATFLPSRNRTYVAPSGTRGMMSGNPGVRTYTSARHFDGSTFSQGSISPSSGGYRSLSQSSGGSRGFSSPRMNMGSFAGSGRGSFGGGGKR